LTYKQMLGESAKNPLIAIAAVIMAIYMLIIVFSPAVNAGVEYVDYGGEGVRVVVVDARTPSRSFSYCGVNYVDYNANDDYAVLGPEAIPGIKSGGSAGYIDILELAARLGTGTLSDYTIWYYDDLLKANVPLVIVRSDYSVVEVVVKPDVDLLVASREIAGALKDLLSSQGYTTLVVVRAVSGVPPSKLEKSFNSVSDAVLRALHETPAAAPEYLRLIMDLQRASMREGSGATYIMVGLDVYGSIGIIVYGPEPREGDLEALARWVRDRSGECEAPLYILYAGSTPPRANTFEALPNGNTLDEHETVEGDRLRQLALVITLLLLTLASAAVSYRLALSRRPT